MVRHKGNFLRTTLGLYHSNVSWSYSPTRYQGDCETCFSWDPARKDYCTVSATVHPFGHQTISFFPHMETLIPFSCATTQTCTQDLQSYTSFSLKTLCRSCALVTSELRGGQLSVPLPTPNTQWQSRNNKVRMEKREGTVALAQRSDRLLPVGQALGGFPAQARGGDPQSVRSDL